MKNYEISRKYIDILVILYFTMFKLLNGFFRVALYITNRERYDYDRNRESNGIFFPCNCTHVYLGITRMVVACWSCLFPLFPDLIRSYTVTGYDIYQLHARVYVMQNGNRDGCRHLKGLEGRARPHALLLLMILQRVRLGVAQTTISSPFETIFF